MEARSCCGSTSRRGSSQTALMGLWWHADSIPRTLDGFHLQEGKVVPRIFGDKGRSLGCFGIDAGAQALESTQKERKVVLISTLSHCDLC